MSNRQQTAFFFVIVFLFTAGFSLLIYRQYNQFIQQSTVTDLDNPPVAAVPVKNPASVIKTKGKIIPKNNTEN